MQDWTDSPDRYINPQVSFLYDISPGSDSRSTMTSTGNNLHYVDQKEEVHHIDHYDDEKASPGEHHSAHVDIDHGYDPAFIAATTRKIDWRLIPPLIAMYCISSIGE